MRKSSRPPNPDPLLIRQATPEDLPLIRALEQQSPTAAHWSERDYGALFAPEAPRRITFVAEDTMQGLAGFIVARSDSEQWEIENLVVAAARQRSGIGSSLVRHALDEARRSHATCVLLEVRESNVTACKLYKKLGFAEIGRRRNYYRNPAENALVLRISIVVR